MKSRRIRGTITAVSLGLGVVHGACSVDAGNRAMRAEEKVEIFEARGRQQAAAEWREYRDDREGDRNRFRSWVIIDIGIAAYLGYSLASEQRQRREQDQ